MADTPQTNHSRVKRFNSFLEEYKFLIEFCGLLAAFAVLFTYLWANHLTSKAIDLSRKQVMSSHIPWLSVKNLHFDVPHGLIIYEIDNSSDSPAFSFEGFLHYESKDDKVIQFVTTAGVNGRHPQFIAPHQGSIRQVAVIPDSKAAIVRDAFRSNKMTITINDTYEDIFGRKFTLVETVEAKKENPDEIEVLSARIEGIEQIR